MKQLIPKSCFFSFYSFSSETKNTSFSSSMLSSLKSCFTKRFFPALASLVNPFYGTGKKKLLSLVKLSCCSADEVQ